MITTGGDGDHLPSAMILRWLRQRRRARLLAVPFPDEWESILTRNFATWSRLERHDQHTLRDLIRIFIPERHWEGCGGLTLDDEIRITIAAQACLLILNLGIDEYRQVRTILVYPTGYYAPSQMRSGSMVIESTVAVLGQAHGGGPVILSWEHVRRGAMNADDGHNLVYHEFAHKLDMADGLVDGTPPINDRELFNDWVRVFSREYETLIAQLEGRAPVVGRPLLRPYGATNPAEFFATATEIFFEQPDAMRRRHAELYDVLSRYFKQDPARWR